MNKNQILLSSLALDLKRIALGYYGGSENMASRFVQEAIKRRDKLRNEDLKPYLRKLILQIGKVLSQKDREKLAEDALMYSVLLQNASLQKS